MTTEKSPSLSILSAVVCDDVRAEDNGKELLIGVYSGTITVHAIPSLPLPLRCWINMKIEGPYATRLQFRAIDHNREEMYRSQTDTKTDDDAGEGSIILGPILFSLKDPEGHLMIDYKEEGGDWINVITKKTRYQRR